MTRKKYPSSRLQPVYAKKYYDRLSEEGLCRHCRKPVVDKSRATCKECSKKITEKTLKRRAFRESQGLCIKCGKNPKLETHKKCDPCRKKELEILKYKREENKRKGLCSMCGKNTPSSIRRYLCEKCASKKRHTASLRHPYREYIEPCIFCGFMYSDIHHRNGNHQDNREINLVSLCPNHHRLLHLGKIKDLDIDTILLDI